MTAAAVERAASGISSEGISKRIGHKKGKSRMGNNDVSVGDSVLGGTVGVKVGIAVDVEGLGNIVGTAGESVSDEESGELHHLCCDGEAVWMVVVIVLVSVIVSGTITAAPSSAALQLSSACWT